MSETPLTIKRLLTDATGQNIVAALNAIASAVTPPDATQINIGPSNTTKVASTITDTQKGLAYIVDGDTCVTAVPAGAYAYIKNNTHSLAEGLYRNKSENSFPTTGGTANSTVFEAVSEGGLNALNSNTMHNGDVANIPSAEIRNLVPSERLFAFYAELANNEYTQGQVVFKKNGNIEIQGRKNNTWSSIAEYSNSKMIKSATKSGTTSATTGVLDLGIGSNAHVVSAYADAYMAMPYFASNTWRVVVIDSSSANGIVQVKNTSVTVTYYYYE